ncbi:general transcription factor 3C polypeptide 5 isoform X1 [Oryzias latipes]|uniref:Ral transcription factor IIIC subunit 5 n=2 Tax=Oryzias latipes TaxID=8090 RepID=H2MHF9_ORYLA|nr:general transcription factor 3C polypeptide 5 isoform X1 [Oryzias latipes]
MAAEPRYQRLDFTLKELTLPGAAEDAVPGSSSTLELRDRKLVCVEYPAVVHNTDKMLDTLGGEQAVSKTFADPNRRLELRFRPQDPFCHSACGNRLSSSNILLRVRRRVRRKDPKDAEIQMDVVGIIGTTYKFQGLADFQYLAVDSQGGMHTSLYDRIILRQTETQEFFEQPVPYFLPPVIFSRLDNPMDYFYRAEAHQAPQTYANKNSIGLNRARRPHNAIFVSFNDAVVPTECLEGARQNWARCCLKDNDRLAEEQIKKMFESRPIWSKNAVKANFNIHPEKLKLLLPLFAYYMVTGPWRSLWVRLGYDPRKDPESKKYQMLDFRMRCSTKHGYSFSKLLVKAKRSSLNYSLPITLNKAVPQATSVMHIPSRENPSTSRDSAPLSYQLKESAYIFREGMLPPYRQMFYQLCDLDVDSIRQAIEQSSGTEQQCLERDGWCAAGTTDKLRDLIFSMIKNVMQAQKQGFLDLPKKKRRNKLCVQSLLKDVDPEEEEEEEECENKEDEDEDDEVQLSDGSENEMETEILDYL